jgi:hypothetical protein
MNAQNSSSETLSKVRAGGGAVSAARRLAWRPDGCDRCVRGGSGAIGGSGRTGGRRAPTGASARGKPPIVDGLDETGLDETGLDETGLGETGLDETGAGGPLVTTGAAGGGNGRLGAAVRGREPVVDPAVRCRPEWTLSRISAARPTATRQIT